MFVFHSYREYKGHAGVIEWVKNIDPIDFQDFTPKIVAVQGDKVTMSITAKPKMKATGKEGALQYDLHEWTVKDGKISKVKFFWGNTKDLSDLWA